MLVRDQNALQYVSSSTDRDDWSGICISIVREVAAGSAICTLSKVAGLAM